MAAVHRMAFYPVLVTQGPWVKWNTLRLPEPDGPREGVVGEGPPLRLLITGDSSAAGVGVSDQSHALSGQLAHRLKSRVRLDWRLVARCGNTTPMALAALHKAPPRPADVAVVGLGVNDLTAGVPLGAWLNRKRAMIDHLRQVQGVRRIYYSGLPPMWQFPRLPNPLRWTLGHQAERYDRALRALIAQISDVTWITLDMTLDHTNMAEDGYHPAAPVYAAWADAIVTQMKADGTL